MCKPKCGNGRRRPKKRSRRRGKPHIMRVKWLEVAHLSLHETDPITGDEERLSSLFYEYYRGYTIYSTEQGRCVLHGNDGCLRIEGKYAVFPDIEQVKNLIKHFLADGRTAQESMDRSVPRRQYFCVNRQAEKEKEIVFVGI